MFEDRGSHQNFNFLNRRLPNRPMSMDNRGLESESGWRGRREGREERRRKPLVPASRPAAMMPATRAERRGQM